MEGDNVSIKAKRILFTLPLLLCILLFISVCLARIKPAQAALDPLAPKSELTITPSKKQVAAFEAQNVDFESPYDTDECYNITPDFIADHSDYTIFKYEESAETFILYDGQIYSLGEHPGRSNITSVALADLNRDGQYELYYTFVWGSGLIRSQIGYFNPANKKITVFAPSVFVSDLMLTVNESGTLCVNTITSDCYDTVSFVDYVVKAQDQIGTITLERNRITVQIDPAILDQKPEILKYLQNSNDNSILYMIERLFYKLGIYI